MNALFRRDYLYEFKNSLHSGITGGTQLRYLNFDRKKKEYVFLEGSKKQLAETEIRVKESKGAIMYSRLKILHHIGYEETDQYLKDTKEVKLCPVVKLHETSKTQQSDTKVFTNVNDMTIGKTYHVKLTCNTGYISSKPLVLESRPIGGDIIATFSFNGLSNFQELNKHWNFIATEVN